MKQLSRLLIALLTACAATGAAAQSDTIFIYCPGEAQGLHLAVKLEGQWQHVGQLCSSDYGAWGSEKRMYAPSVCQATDGTWRLVFQVNDHSPLFAAAYSTDLITWRPQDYPIVSTRKCLKPVVRQTADGFEVIYQSEQGMRHVTATPDFRHFSTDTEYAQSRSMLIERTKATVDDKQVEGQTFIIPTEACDKILEYHAQQSLDERLSGERMHDDGKNSALTAEPMVFATLNVENVPAKRISDKLIGIFFEDISYAADGGLYAEMIQNRDFEYSPRDHKGWTGSTAWHSPADITIAESNPLSENNRHYAIVKQDSLWNEGWDGIAVTRGKAYDFSMFVSGMKEFTVKLITEDGETIAETAVTTGSKKWKRYEATLTATKTCAKARLLLLPKGKKEARIDMVSLFPQETFKNRKNGLRKDLAETIARLRPKFVRFPGGCMSHGQGVDNIYHWHHTIGALQDRVPDFNIWHYHQTRGLGFYEYFQFCEDIGAEPLPVLAAGVPCQNSANNADNIGGQQGGIPMDEMPAYIDELCNLIDWANGDPKTNEWARKRAEAGHPKPFNLKYLGIGNEDIISTVFEERYEMICKAIGERHPEIKICGTVGPFHYPSADYQEGWDFTRRNPQLQSMVDEHYYESTGWFMHHRDYYDDYPRQTKVYLGEWAASTKVKRPNLETALAEALYLTDIERNGDVVEMTSYAPMLCKNGHSNWNPNMIYFSNTGIQTTPAYEVQRLFSVYGGNLYEPTRLEVNDKYRHRIGTSLVKDERTGRRYLKLVNALPVPLQFSVIGLDVPETVTCQELTGESITDQKATTRTVETSQPLTLPAYTIRVIEL